MNTKDSVKDNVISIEPLIRKRAQRTCGHRRVEIDTDAAVLSCLECGAPLDPWWYLRRLANDDSEYREYQAKLAAETEAIVARQKEIIDNYNRWATRVNAEIERLGKDRGLLRGEVSRLKAALAPSKQRRS